MKRVISVLLAILIPFILFIASITALSQIPFFYSHGFDKFGTVGNAGIDAESKEIADMMVDFITGNREEFQIAAAVNGIKRELFNPKEQKHMEDVRQLIQMGNKISIIGVVAAVFLYILLYMKDKNAIRTAYKISIGVFVFFLTAMALISIIDFNEGFTIFHELLFTNDLWLLDPNQDILLMLMPLEFFMDALKTALIINISAMIIIGVITWKITKTRKRLFP